MMMEGRLRVSSNSAPGAVAGAIANGIREGSEMEMQMIGPRAVNQGVKAIAIARGYVAPSGLDLYFTPCFATLQIEGEERTAVEFVLRVRHPLHPSVHVAQE